MNRYLTTLLEIYFGGDKCHLHATNILWFGSICAPNFDVLQLNIIILYIFIFMGCFAVMSFIVDGFMAFSWFKLTESQ